MLDRIHRDLLGLGGMPPAKRGEPYTIRRPWEKKSEPKWVRDFAARVGR